MTEHLSDLQLDGIRLTKASPEAQAHLSSCARCQARQAELTEDQEAFLSRFNPAQLAAQTIQRRDTAHRPGWRRWSWPVLPAGLAVAAALFFVRPQPELRTKGDNPSLEVFLVTAAGPTPMRSAVAPNAHLAVRVLTDRPRYVRLLWQSEPKGWQALYPDQGAESWSIKEPTWLAREVVLDGDPQAEALGVVLCASPVGHDEAAERLRRPEQGECTTQVVQITKR